MTDVPKLFGVGLGPGDPELLTLKALRILREVDWVYIPTGRQGSFAGRILTSAGIPEQKTRRVELCMSRTRETDQSAYQRAATEIASLLQEGHSVAWAAEGDPLLYSTFLHLYAEMRRSFPALPIEIVPGVSSTLAAAARVGVPVANLGERVAIVPAAYGLQCLPDLLGQCETVFLIKVHCVFDELLDLLGRLPTSVRTWYLEKVGTAEERVITDLSTLRGRKPPYFSLVILRQDGSYGRGTESSRATPLP
jgi:precorrin-2/cobalt-factor-2 C20-methyltransferase